MSKEKRKILVPKLRFPEFNNDGEWINDPLNSIAKLIDERAGTNEYIPMSVTPGVGLISQKDKFGREIAGSQYKNYYVIKKWDFAYNKSATKLYPEGYITILKDVDEAAVPNSIFTCFRTDQGKIYPPFLDYLFEDNFHGKWLRKFIEVGGRAHGLISIDPDILLKMPIVYPKLNEQQKIADCLSSLDELITTEIQKLEALKAHKKGLMQNLFPAEGEKMPKVRFKEFENSGDWLEKSIEEILIESRLGGNYENSETNTGIPVIKMGNLDRGKVNTDKMQYLPENEEYNNEDVLKKGDLLFNTRNTLELVGKVAIWREEVPFAIYNSNLLSMKFKRELVASNYFMNYAFNTQYVLRKLKRVSTGTTSVAAIYGKDLNRIKLDLPSIKEQQKIADCLSSLDELIATQSQKLELLKEHKKGLMQNLFPNFNREN